MNYILYIHCIQISTHIDRYIHITIAHTEPVAWTTSKLLPPVAKRTLQHELLWESRVWLRGLGLGALHNIYIYIYIHVYIYVYIYIKKANMYRCTVFILGLLGTPQSAVIRWPCRHSMCRAPSAGDAALKDVRGDAMGVAEIFQMHICLYVRVYVCMCVCMYVCLHLYPYVCICLSIYLYIQYNHPYKYITLHYMTWHDDTLTHMHACIGMLDAAPGAIDFNLARAFSKV